MGQVFFIAEPDPVVRLDLAGALRDQFPTEPVVAGAHVPWTDNRLSGRNCFLFISRYLADGTVLDAIRVFVRKGVQIVFVGGTVEADFPAATLDFPFTNDMILTTITSVAVDPPERQLEDRT